LVEATGNFSSQAGNTTKIHLAVDAYGLPVEFEVSDPSPIYSKPPVEA
jgi:hypothetical protein